MTSTKRRQISSRNRAGSGGFTPFWHTVTHALETVREPKRMGQESPLAAPYLLGNRLSGKQATSGERGRILGTLLQDAVKKIDGKNGDRYQQILNEYYFLGKSVQVVCDTIGLGKTTFHDNRKRAISRLESMLIETLQPAIRLEAPPSLIGVFVGREPEIDACRSALESGRSLSISGPSGVGKTTLGRFLWHQWDPSLRFWFTICPGINDNQSSLLFALGYFLSRCGQPALWQEILANHGTIASDHALQMVRHAVSEIEDEGNGPLFCIDNVELLQPDAPQHDQIRHLLDSLCRLTKLIIIGQHVPVATASFCQLSELSNTQVRKYLEEENLTLSAKQEARLYEATKGNSRLLMLFASLYKQYQQNAEDGDLDRLIEQISTTPTVEFMLSRILTHLGPNELSLLMSLSVYRDAAPADVWQNKKAHGMLELLLRVRLIELDLCGGARILPIYRKIIEDNIPHDRKQALHVHAAKIYADRAQYTPATYHYIRAEQPESAIWLWRENQQSEINQGRGNEAREIFEQVQVSALTKPLDQQSAECLRLIQADLAYLTGDFSQALQTIQSIFWETPILSVEADVARGKFAAELSEFENAQRYYQDALDSAALLLHGQLVRIHKGLGWIHMRNRSMNLAWREASLSRFEAENLQGILLEMQYERKEAISLYRSALQVAQEIGHQSGIARVNLNLSMLYTTLGNFEEAESYLEYATAAFQQLGEEASITGTMINRALIYNLSGKHHQAIDMLQQTKKQLSETRKSLSPWQDALIAQGFAEAYLGVSRLDEAEKWARHAIALEEGDVLADSYRTLGEIMLVRGNVDDARQHISFSTELCQQMDEPDLYLLGYAWRAMVNVEIQAGNEEAAAEARERAVEIFQEIQLPHEVERVP